MKLGKQHMEQTNRNHKEKILELKTQNKNFNREGQK